MKEINDRRGDPFFAPGVIATIAAAVILAVGLFIWAPWISTRMANNAAPGVATGQSANTPLAGPAPAPAPQQ